MQHCKPRKFVNYCGIGGGTIFGKSFRMSHGGSSFQLSNYAAEEHLKAKYQGDITDGEGIHFAIESVENSKFDKKFKDFCDYLN